MCGVAGLYCLDAECSARSHEVIVAKMRDLLTHRGPDDSGLVSLGRVCLGTRRLSIIDLSPAGHMPMSDESGRWWISYNGEVYNFRELREELESRGHRFRSRTDSEVVLHSFMEWGEGCIERFIGMFAFAIYDRTNERLVLARDRYGIKPMYYMRIDGHILFGSEIKALASVADPALEKQRLLEWFLYRNIDSFAPDTLFDGVFCVLAGHVVSFTPESTAVRTVYQTTAHVSPAEHERFGSMKRAEVVDQIDAMLCDATRLRLVSDVPVGTLLSGGLDSSLVTAIAARETRELTAFHVSVAGYPDLDERRFAEALTGELGLELVSHTLTGEDFRRELPQAVYLSDFPLSHPNSVAYLLISRVVRAHGVIVVLSGEGADELFGGYSFRYRRARRMHRLAPLFEKIPERPWQVLTLLTYARAGLPVTAFSFRDLLPPTIALVDRFERFAWLEECKSVYSFVSSPADRAALGAALADLNEFLSPLLRRLDRMTMGASVECRVPYLDHRLVHTVINLPLAYRVGTLADKWVLREVAKRYIPQRSAKRKKRGFPLPLKDYLAPIADPKFFADGFCQQHLGLNRRGMNAFLADWDEWVLGFFGLLTMEIWGRLFFRGESLDEVRERLLRLEPVRNGGASVTSQLSRSATA